MDITSCPGDVGLGMFGNFLGVAEEEEVEVEGLVGGGGGEVAEEDEEEEAVKAEDEGREE